MVTVHYSIFVSGHLPVLSFHTCFYLVLEGFLLSLSVFFLEATCLPDQIYNRMNTGGVSALNPNYGKVKQLCAQLGYGSKDKDDPRYFDKLSKKVIAYRKSFITDRMEQVTNFPLNYDHEQVQRCAEHFLEDNSNLFCQDQEGLIRPTFLSAHDM